MNYLNEKEQQLRDALKAGYTMRTEKDWEPWVNLIVEMVREMVLESYRNGQTASKSGRTGGRSSAIAAGKLKPVQ
ncbi:hypothetical protein COU79_00210 [Candidatus Peregrinibacteria bacterium CG10_big_fil_rev_8_21_14_0_10_54_7]|nr:MAG: hypothetical protein COU79_00210 [Candidatus Peregrinibacteria bacterium CG10_big_fil_rev_8_21_14_0_10_54_7]